METSIIEPAHACLAPSKMSMHMKCLKSLVPPDPPVVDIPSPHAEEGTKAHELLRFMLDHPGKPFLCDDPEMEAHVTALYGIIERVKNKIGKENILTILVEERVQFSEHIWGTVDVAILYVKEGEKRLYMIDLKYGRGVGVPAKGNQQLKTYAAAIKQSKNWDFQRATLAIYQPRNSDACDTPLDQFEITGKELKKYETELKRFEKKALKVLAGDIKAKEVPGDHCRWCKRNGQCEGRAKWASAAGLLVLGKAEPLSISPGTEIITVKKGKKEVEKKVIKVSNIPDDKLSDILLYANDMREFLKSVEKYAAQRCVSGNPLPGWKVVAGRTYRKWIDDEGKIIKALNKKGVKHPCVITLRKLSDIEREIGKGEVDDLVYSPDPKPKLVPESDKRPALTSAALALLDVIEEEDVD